MKLSIIIPVYNEETTISRIIRKIKNTEIDDLSKEIIVVDDFSTDDTRRIIKDIKSIKKIFHEKNKGKGAAIKSGLDQSTGDIIIIQDADLEYDPQDYKKVIKPIIKKQAKIVFGSRFKGNKNKKGNLITFLGNKLITIITNILYLTHLSDQMTCYKAFDKSLINTLKKAKGNRFDWEPEITANLLKKGYNIKEIPILYYPRTNKQGKKIRIMDGIQVIKTLIKIRFEIN